MELDKNTRLAALIQVGKDLAQLSGDALAEVSARAGAHNGWFTEESVALAIKGTARYLEESALRNWAAQYDIPELIGPKKIGLIMAGNLPLVGIHDLICVLVSGHQALVKLSSQDPYLPKYFADLLTGMDKRFEQLLHFAEGPMNEMEAVIATGSNNSSRYFDYYFGKYPHIIRKNRTSCAVLDGSETPEQLAKLAEDVLNYFGLGCRNVAKLFVPKDYDLSPVLKASTALANKAAKHHKYVNNYDYHKSIYLVNQDPFLDNGALMLKESEGYHSPASVLFYEEYDDLEKLRTKLKTDAESLQCIVTNDGWLEGSVPFGKAQWPEITDYADHVDTMKFLLGL